MPAATPSTRISDRSGSSPRLGRRSGPFGERRSGGSLSKRRRGLLGILLLLALGGAFVWAKHGAERRSWTRNVQHDAEWLFLSLNSGSTRPLEHQVGEMRSDAQLALMASLALHASTLSATDFSALQPDFSTGGGDLSATFTCADGVRVVFTSVDDGEYWNLAAIVSE
jgi:hypothetical protein